MEVQTAYQAKLKAKMSNVKKLAEIENEDSNVKAILEVLRGFYNFPMDSVAENILLNTGGKLLGRLVKLTTDISYKKAELMSAEQAYDELLSSMTVLNKSDDMGITESRNVAKSQLADVANDLILKEHYKNSYEAIAKITEMTIYFLQSTLSTKKSERFTTNRFSNE